MMTLVLRRGQPLWRMVALGLGFLMISGSWAMSFDDGLTGPNQNPKKWSKLLSRRQPKSQGTLGYGPQGVFPGFQGFGLGYLRGYGYGGDALGVGAEGGYSFYGGPGYPHPSPCLRRIGGITPFPYFGGPGGPSPEQPHFFGPAGPLNADQPIVTYEGDSPDASQTGYGYFTGTLPYAESTFAPFTSMYGGERSSNGANSNSSSNSPPTPTSDIPPVRNVPESTDAGRSLGLETEPFLDAGLVKGLKIIKIRNASPAEKAGLQLGDVIRSTNGYLTEQPGNLTWIIANAAPDNVLTLIVLTPKDSEVHTFTIRRP